MNWIKFVLPIVTVIILKANTCNYAIIPFSAYGWCSTIISVTALSIFICTTYIYFIAHLSGIKYFNEFVILIPCHLLLFLKCHTLKMYTIAERRKKNRKKQQINAPTAHYMIVTSVCGYFIAKLKFHYATHLNTTGLLNWHKKTCNLWINPIFSIQIDVKYIAFFYKDPFYFPKIQWNWQRMWTTLNHFHVLCFNFPSYDLNSCKFSWKTSPSVNKADIRSRHYYNVK